MSGWDDAADPADLVDLWDRPRDRPPRPRVFPPNRWTRAEVERRIAHEPVEWAVVFDSTGQQIYRARGIEAAVVIRLKPPELRDGLLIHNHPMEPSSPLSNPSVGAGSFSDHDLGFAIGYDLAEMVVITPGWRYRVVRPSDGWTTDAESAVAYSTEQWEEVKDEFAREVATGRMTITDAERRLKDEVTRPTADWAGFGYQQERFEP